MTRQNTASVIEKVSGKLDREVDNLKPHLLECLSKHNLRAKRRKFKASQHLDKVFTRINTARHDFPGRPRTLRRDHLIQVTAFPEPA